MNYKFEDYNIHIEDSENYPGKFDAYIEELFDVYDVIDNKSQAVERLRPLFDIEIKRLTDGGENIPKPGSGKALITFAPSDKIESLGLFMNDFWEKILGTSYSTSFVSNESVFRDWEHYLDGGKPELIDKVKNQYSFDISNIYDKPIHEILTMIKNSK